MDSCRRLDQSHILTCNFLRILGFQIAPHLVGSYIISWLQIGPPTSQKSITKLTNIGSTLKIGSGPQKETSIPTIHFQMRNMSVSLDLSVDVFFRNLWAGNPIPAKPTWQFFIIFPSQSHDALLEPNQAMNKKTGIPLDSKTMKNDGFFHSHHHLLKIHSW